MKKIGATLLAFIMTASLAGCGQKQNEKVSLTIWRMEDQEFLQSMADEFKEHYKDEVDIEIKIGDKPEHSMVDFIKNNPADAADVFYFADDQMTSFINEDLLLPITINTDSIIEANGGKDANIVKCATSNDKLYAYPLTASNGYFLMYNAEYLSESDVETLDGILDVAAKNNKKFAMDWTSGWYLYSFFGGAGLDVTMNSEGTENICNWNASDTKYKGVDVAEAMLKIAEKPGFSNTDDSGFLAGVENDSVIAGINGPWNAETLSQMWGDNFRATKLPTYTLSGEQVQMSGFIGYKFVGVNSKTENSEWAMKFAEWISDYDNQLKRFDISGECPSNVKAAAAEKVQSSQVSYALAKQTPYSVQQNVSDAFWSPSSLSGTVMASGNPDKIDLQKLLDDTVSDITAKK